MTTSSCFIGLALILTGCMIGLSALRLYARRKAKQMGIDVPPLRWWPW